VDPTKAEPKHVADFLKGRPQPTALRYGRLLERVYEQQIAVDAVSFNPVTQMRSLLVEEELRAPTVALEVQTASELIKSLPPPNDWQEHRDQAVTVLAAAAGLRLRELRELQVIQFVPRAGGLEVQPRGRTVTSREVMLEPAAADFVRSWLKARAALQFEAPSDLAFPGRNGEMLPVNTFYRRVRRLLEAIYGDGLPSFGVGVLRATFACHFPKEKVVEAQHALGHRKLTSSFRLFRHLKPIKPSRAA
jgi:site-specific recombinase XerC